MSVPSNWASLIALGVLDLATEDRGRQLVRLVADHEVPAAVRRLQLGLHVLVARQLVEAGDDEVVLEEPVAGNGRRELVVGEDLEVQVEAAAQFVLPLLGQAAGADHEAALQVPAHDELFHQQAGHDRLARAGVVGQHHAQRQAWQHRLVDGRNLVRQGLDVGGMDGQQRVKEVRQADALRLGHQAEEGAVAVKAPGAALLHQLQACFVFPVEQHVAGRAPRRLVGKFEGG